ncbi:MAG: hypothetical protein KGH58_03370 [Candidatus Micrarchaeota archaeon]|nr:hypothetical protein [Candidatus Micrarchaeota archaeon]
MATQTATKDRAYAPTREELQGFVGGKKGLGDILLDLRLRLGDATEQEKSAALGSCRNELIDAKISATKTLYTGRWFLEWGQMVAFADVINNGARTLTEGVHEVPRYTMPGRFSLSASKSVSKDFATIAKQWGMLITLDAGKVNYYHPNTLLEPKGLSKDPDAVTIGWVQEEEVRVRSLDRRAVIGVDVFSRGERIISYNSFPSELALLADIRGNI